jgi:hypothetical protein
MSGCTASTGFWTRKAPVKHAGFSFHASPANQIHTQIIQYSNLKAFDFSIPKLYFNDFHTYFKRIYI